MIPPRPTELAHVILREFLRPGEIAVDATAGNGNDTLFLAKFTGPTGKVVAFDIQREAVESTRSKLAAAGLADHVEVIEVSHGTMTDHVAAASAGVVMFNLGYLPGADHETTTETRETLVALDAAAKILKPGGLLSVVCYPGHPGGDAEAEAVEQRLGDWAGDAGWRVARYGMMATKSPAPFLLIARKPADAAEEPITSGSP